MRVFQKLIFRNHIVKYVFLDKEILTSVLFSLGAVFLS